MRRVSVTVSGTVQGVFFRRETRLEALKLGLTGFVRNRPDGTVFLEAQGPEDKVGALIRWCRTGPAHARVHEVRVTDIPAHDAAPDASLSSGDGFQILY